MVSADKETSRGKPKNRKAGQVATSSARVGSVVATIRPKFQITVPEQFRKELHLDVDDQVIMTVEDGRLVLTPSASIPRDQLWFWTPEWQAGEREASEQLARGEGEIFESGEDFLADLDQVIDTLDSQR